MKRILSLLFATSFCIVVNARFINQINTTDDSITVSIDNIVTVSSKGYQPHWISANNWGIINGNEPLNIVNNSSVHGVLLLKEKLVLQIGLNGVVRNSASYPLKNKKVSAYLNEWYGALRFWKLYFSVGAKKVTMGEVNNCLSSGSLHLSNNARPIPQFLFSTQEWINVPYTSGLLSFKGLFSHGWLNDNRYIKDAFIHNKNAYLKVGRDNYLWLGINHTAIWGGDDHGDKLPSNFTAFWTVVKAGKYPYPEDFADKHYGEALNRYGFHTGTFDLGLQFQLGTIGIRLYNQCPFTDSSGMRQYFFNKDYLRGIELSFGRKLVSEVVIELLSTTWQSGHGLGDPKINGTTVPLTEESAHLYYEYYGDEVAGMNFDELSEFIKLDQNKGYEWGGRDHYYNNSIYQTGFTNEDALLSNSLLGMHSRISRFTDKTLNSNITNNRVKGFHIAVKGFYRESWSYLIKCSYTKNYGNYHDYYSGLNDAGEYDRWTPNTAYYFHEPLKQYYTLLEVDKVISSHWKLKLKLAQDFGDMSSVSGLAFSLLYSPDL